MEAAQVSAVASVLRGSVSTARSREWEFAVEAAGEKHGKALLYLLRHMPEADRAHLPVDLLLENVDLAFQARDTFAWAGEAALSEDLFYAYVLPYCVFDEHRDEWRPHLYPLSAEIVAGAKSVSEAVQLINEKIFPAVNVKYSTERRAPNQCVSESIKLGKASCTGLTILAVNACRAVGIPARAVGTALWAKGSGNHTWFETFCEDKQWHFTGAAEPDPSGLDRAWFVSEAAKAVSNSLNGIFATSYERRPLAFPLVWAPQVSTVFADDVTLRYKPKRTSKSPTIQALITAIDAGSRDWDAFADVPLTRSEAAEARKLLWDAHVERIRRERTRETLLDKCIRLEGKEMPFSMQVCGDVPASGRRPVVISLHGGGGCPKHVNDQQWVNQVRDQIEGSVFTLLTILFLFQQRLYQDCLPAGCIYVCPRGPTDNWNLWHEGHVDAMLIRLIENLIVLAAADSDRVYLIGYSAGGDGVYKLSPRLASVFAGCGAFAGHPNGEPLLGLRNLPFSICVGALDDAYKRNSVGKEYAAELTRLEKEDGRGGYVSQCVFPNTGHWMNGAESAAVRWMCSHPRVSRPDRVVWKQNSDTVHSWFYNVSTSAPQKNALVCVDHTLPQEFVVTQRENAAALTLYVDDLMADLDRDVTVRHGEKVLFHGRVPRTIRSMRDSLEARGDPSMMFDGRIEL